jgi:hypothetical protein
MQHHELLELFRDKRPFGAEGGAGKSEDGFVLVGGLCAAAENPRGRNEEEEEARNRQPPITLQRGRGVSD